MIICAGREKGKTKRGVAPADFETEANGDSGSTLQMKGVLPWLVRWAH